jgi:hypothetical protein
MTSAHIYLSISVSRLSDLQVRLPINKYRCIPMPTVRPFVSFTGVGNDKRERSIRMAEVQPVAR